MFPYTEIIQSKNTPESIKIKTFLYIAELYY